MMMDNKIAGGDNTNNVANIEINAGHSTSAKKLDIDLFSDDFVKAQEELWHQFTNLKMPPRASSPRTTVDDPRPRPTRNNEDLSDLFEDQAMIEEQRRILLSIQQKRAGGKQQEDLPHNKPPQANGGELKSTLHRHDRVVRMGHQDLRVKGTKHCYDAISNGEATIVQCSSCQSILQVSSTAKLLFCVHCQQVTPMDVAKNVSGGRIGATDASIAKTMQMQEVGVASVRKQQGGAGSSKVSVTQRTRPKNYY
jgi:hypothetical protein